MNNQTQNCQPDLLESFLNGDLGRVQELQLTEHLDSCGVCRELLESTAAEPNRWLEASRLLKPTRFDWNPGDAQDASDDQLHSVPHQVRNVLDSLAPAEDPKMLGQLGGYQVSGVVGAGAMGVVLKAADKSLDRTVAIKVLSPHLASSGAARKRFAREAKAAAAVLHPNVIAIHGVSNDPAMPHLVMPYVRGASLQKRINDHGALPVKEVLRIGAQVAAGLAAAHAQGLVHRDIKPANILLEEGVERVAITDFGLARAVDDASLTRTGFIAGTPQYMSPEQSRGDAVDQRSDLFSLGSVMYAMCTGRLPFRCKTTYGVIQRINHDQPTSIREINPDVPLWLAQVVEKLMSKHAEDRYESAQEVSDLLEQCLAHVQQPSTTLLPDACVASDRSSGFFSGGRRRTGSIAMVITFGFGLLGMFLWQATDPPDISGKWYGDGWGEVELKHQALGQYKGEYSDTFGDQLGTMELKWSRLERRFNGKWREGKDRLGKISLRHADDRIFGACTTSEKSSVNTGRPELADLQWNRRQSVAKSDPARLSSKEQQVEGIVEQQDQGDDVVFLEQAFEEQKDIVAAIKVANRFVTATLRGRKTEMKNLLSPSHSPFIGTDFMDEVMPIIFGKNPEFTEAYIHHQNPNDVLLATPEFAADRRVWIGPLRLLIGMKREKEGWRVSEVSPFPVEDAKQVIAFYETEKPSFYGFWRFRDRKATDDQVPEELGRALAILRHNARMAFFWQELNPPYDKLDLLQKDIDAAREEVDRIRNEIRNRESEEQKPIESKIESSKRSVPKFAPKARKLKDSPVDPQMQPVNYRGVCVQDDDGRPIADAMVRLFLYRKSTSDFVLAKFAQPDQEGRFSIRGSVRNDFDLTASRIAISSPGLATSVFFYQPAGDTVPKIKLVASASITGKVTDSDSKPVHGATVILGKLPGVWQARTDVDGRFEIADVPRAEALGWGASNIVMAINPESEALTTTVIKSVPTDVEISIRDIPMVPSPLARSAQDALTYHVGIQGNWRMTSQVLNSIQTPKDELKAADIRWWFAESQMSLRELNWSGGAGGRVIYAERGEEIGYEYKMLPGGSIELKKMVDGEPGESISGKYRLRGDRLWVALPANDDRPVTTASNATGKDQQRGVKYFTFERADPVRITAPEADLFFETVEEIADQPKRKQQYHYRYGYGEKEKPQTDQPMRKQQYHYRYSPGKKEKPQTDHNPSETAQQTLDDVSEMLKRQSGQLSMQEALDLYGRHVKPAVIWASHPTEKRGGGAKLQLVVFEDGTVIARGQNAWRGQLTPDEKNDLMKFIREDQKFSQIRSIDYEVLPETLNLDLPRAKIYALEPSQIFHESIQVGSTEFKLQAIYSASESGELTDLNPSIHFKNITRRLLRIKSTTVIGGPDELKFYLDIANRELKRRFPHARPLTLDDEFAAVVSKTDKSENSWDSRWLDFYYQQPYCLIQIKHIANKEPEVRRIHYRGSANSDKADGRR